MGKGLGGMLGKIPGMGGLAQMNQMRKMAQSMMSGGMPAGFPGMPGMGDVFGGGSAAAPRKIDRDKLKKLRKAAKDARKKNRR
jgi:signal recognition particle subunit SRP54